MRRDRTHRILAEGVVVSNDTWTTGINNNTLIIGSSGAGKTRGYVIPNILASEGSIVVTDTKGELYNQPVHVILDDFACGCWVKDFDNYISVIRSRGIYTSLIVQSISQLQGLYGYRASTIVENCDTMLYLGGNDPETARVIGGRVNKPPHTILAMPVNESLIIRRGQSALTVRRNTQPCLDENDEAERETNEAEIA